MLDRVSYWPEEDWQRMWSGEDCGICSDAHLVTNPFGDLIAETEWPTVAGVRDYVQVSSSGSG